MNILKRLSNSDFNVSVLLVFINDSGFKRSFYHFLKKISCIQTKQYNNKVTETKKLKWTKPYATRLLQFPRQIFMFSQKQYKVTETANKGKSNEPNSWEHGPCKL